ncbi:MAG: ornithine carbamoyltransferase [Polyangiaceae bacterium]|nr:ornithine carbamoyltransferase [Polyangiaceae bacterium]
MTRHFIELADLGEGGIVRALDSADHFLETRGTSEHPRPLTGKSIGLVFQKASTRTRLSLEVAVSELGGHPVVLTSSGSQLGRGEPIKDTARVLGRMVHGITFRTFSHGELMEMVDFAGVPVLNALTDAGHPMQILADLQTVRRKLGKLAGLKYCWLGDGNNMANSWIEAAGLLQLELALACPEGYDPDAAVVSKAKERGAKLSIARRPEEAIEGADVVSTDVFTSMGQEAESAARLKAFAGYELNETLLEKAATKSIVLHCLPAHRGEEISEAVLEGSHSVVWDEAEARLHTSKALFAWAFGG